MTNKINWQEEDAKGNVIGAAVAGVGCLLPMLIILAFFFVVAILG